MKATGIVRRIDELGRVVIPKEIRRTQRIRQGDTLEIFTAADGEVVLKNTLPWWSWGISQPSTPRCLPKAWDVPCWYVTGPGWWRLPAAARPI